MRPHINIALMAWTLLFAISNFMACVSWASKGNKMARTAGILSFLSLFTALLAIGQYIK